MVFIVFFVVIQKILSHERPKWLPLDVETRGFEEFII